MQGMQEWKVESVYFSVASEADIRARSVVSVTTADLYSRERRAASHTPASGGLLDERLGANNATRRKECVTCGLLFGDCPGHWGHIELEEPVYHVSHLDRLLKVVSSVCFFCGTLLIDDGQQLRRLPAERRLELASKAGKARKEACFQCGHELCRVVKVPSKGLLSVLFGEGEGLESGLLYARDVLQVLNKISADSCELLGLHQRPEVLVLTAFPVPPLNLRPTSLSGRDRRECELTLKLRRIVSLNLALAQQQARKRSPLVRQQQVVALQAAVNEYLVGESKASQSSIVTDRKQAAESMTLRDRLKGKKGRMRWNMMGKRVDFAARTVIVPDSYIAVDQVSVPLFICMKLTRPERVTPQNLQRLTAAVQRGPSAYPGANYVIRADGSRMDLHVCSAASVRLQLGDSVERHLVEGDVVFMNRQPTLHRVSMMGHYLVPRSGQKTIGLNTAVCKAYNADFDGDEMNLHVPQTEEARAELLELCMVRHHMISPKTCSPVITLVQDPVLAVYLMTQPGVRVSARQLSLILGRLEKCDWPNLQQRQEWSGKELFSFALPAGLYLRKKRDEDDEEPLLIHDGQLLSGVLTAGDINGRSGILRVIHKELGAGAALDFLNAAQLIGNTWLAQQGVSIGLSDMLLKPDDVSILQEIKRRAEQDFQSCSQQRSLSEKERRKKLNDCREKCTVFIGKAVEGSGNRLAQTIEAGSKGARLNLTQIDGCVGTQEIRGALPQVSENSGRLLPYCLPGQHSMLSSGFIHSSYISGLSKQEFAINAAAGREGLLDTALKTSETGYMQRRLIKALEDVTVRYDGSVRRSDGAIIQTCYGGLGLDPMALELQTLQLHKWSYDELRQSHLWDDRGAGGACLQQERSSLLTLWNYVSGQRERLQQWMSSVAVAFHVPRLCYEAGQRYPLSESEPIVGREYAASALQRACSQLTREADQRYCSDSVLLHHWALLESAASKVVVLKHRLSRPALDWLLQRALHHFRSSVIQPGEAVGVLAGQSVGCTATQMTLNTFHFTGQRDMDVTLGVKRLKEVVNASHTKQARITLKLLPPEERPPGWLSHMRSFIALCNHTRLSSLLQSVSLCSMRDGLIQRELSLQEPYLLLESEEYSSRLSQELLRLECNPTLAGTAIPMELLLQRLQQLLGNEKYILMCSDSNDSSFSLPTVHIRYLQPLTARGQVSRGKHALKRLQRARQLLTSANTLLLPVESGGVQLRDSRQGEERPPPGAEFGEELVLSSRAFGSELLLLAGTDPLHSYCNDFKVVAEVLGIEAAREVLLQEAVKVMCFGGDYILPAHIGLLVDVMTYTGELCGATRTGVLRHQVLSPLMQCSFEETVNVLKEAAVQGKTDSIRGVSECIMMGRPPRVGTHSDLEILQPQQPLQLELQQEEEPFPLYSMLEPEEADYEEQPCLTFDDVYSSLAAGSTECLPNWSSELQQRTWVF